jgi:UDP-N-acetylglucosamine 2-epimerase (non-hydrolysing)
VKIAPIYHAFKRHHLPLEIVHTGQHYDDRMSGLFFRQLGVPPPVVNLAVGSGTHAWQTAEIMRRFEPVVAERKPRLVLVVGDVNSTVACALVAAKMGVRLAHVEAGLRSFDRSMPEEINRIVTDALADDLFVTEPVGVRNLRKEGVSPERIHLVGDVLADALRLYRRHVKRAEVLGQVFKGRRSNDPPVYAVLTLHRPANVDDPAVLCRVLRSIERIAKIAPVVFPVHPRTQQRLQTMLSAQGRGGGAGLICTAPLGYIDFIRLLSGAKLLLTDSGGAQQEAFILGVPCLTLRDTTERPLTLIGGMNRLLGSDEKRIVDEASAILSGDRRPRRREYWYIDGRAGDRIALALSTRA